MGNITPSKITLNSVKPIPTIYDYLLVKCECSEVTRPQWYIRLSVQGTHWVDFALYNVCYRDDNTGVLMFLPEGWTASPEDACPWSEKSGASIKGFIKWDGCTEFSASDHFCFGAESIAEFHAAIQFALEKAHTFLDAEWKPVAPDLTTHFLKEMQLFDRQPEVLKP